MKKLLRNLKVRSKMLCMIVPTILLLALLGVLSLLFMSDINKVSTFMSNNLTPSIIIAEELNTSMSDFRILEFKHVLTQDEKAMNQYENQLSELQKTINSYFNDYIASYLTDDKDSSMIHEAKTQWEAYLQLHNTMITESSKNSIESATALLNGESEQLFDTLANQLLSLVDYNKSLSDAASLDSDETFSSAFYTMIIIILSIILLIVIIGLIVTSVIVSPIKEIDLVAREIANENLDQCITYESKDELGVLASNFGKTVNRLKHYIDYINEIAAALETLAKGTLYFDLQYEYTGEFAKIKTALLEIFRSFSHTIGSINSAAESVSNGSEQMASGAQVLAEGATEQAGTVEELVATITDITSKITKNASDATSVGTLISEVDMV